MGFLGETLAGPQREVDSNPRPGPEFFAYSPPYTVYAPKLAMEYPDIRERVGVKVSPADYVTRSFGAHVLTESPYGAERVNSKVAERLVRRRGKSPDIIAVVSSHLPEAFVDDPDAQNLALHVSHDLEAKGLTKLYDKPTANNTHTFSGACGASGFAFDWLRMQDPKGQEVLLIFDELEYRATLPESAGEDPDKTRIIFSDRLIAMQGKYGEDFEVLASEVVHQPDTERILVMKTPALANPHDSFFTVYPTPYADHIGMQGYPLFEFFRDQLFQNPGHTIKEFLQQAGEQGVDLDKVTTFLNHQASAVVVKRFNKGVRQIFDELGYSGPVYYDESGHRYGNTSAASTIFGLREAIRSGAVKGGDLVLGNAFGGGLTSSKYILRIGQEA